MNCVDCGRSHQRYTPVTPALIRVHDIISAFKFTLRKTTQQYEMVKKVMICIDAETEKGLQDIRPCEVGDLIAGEIRSSGVREAFTRIYGVMAAWDATSLQLRTS